jgi:transglutaminase-like putative cysteine protease
MAHDQAGLDDSRSLLRARWGGTRHRFNLPQESPPVNIEIGFDISLSMSTPNAVVFMLNVNPDRKHDLISGDAITVKPGLPMTDYIDAFGNHCGRVNVTAGYAGVRLQNTAVIRDAGLPDRVDWQAIQHEPQNLPADTLRFLLPSRYCEVDSSLLNFAWNQFGSTPLGWGRVQAICDFVHHHLRFDYAAARSNRSALEGFAERTGVCRDFAHLAVTLCRCMNIPARYATGYLGDIGVPAVPYPMDFSAWFEVYLGDRWYTFDARHNTPRIGRIVIGRGRDAGDVALTMTFGAHSLANFTVVTRQLSG